MHTSQIYVFAYASGFSPSTFIAELSEANNRDLWASKSQLAFIHILRTYVHRTARFVSTLPRPRGGQGTRSKWRLSSNTDVVFELSARRVRELGKSITQFHQGRRTTAPRLVECV